MNRTLCNVLEEMRQCYKTRNFAALNGLIEEAQSMGNRMEAGLYDKGDLERTRKRVKDAQKEYERLLDIVNKLREEAGLEAYEEKYFYDH